MLGGPQGRSWTGVENVHAGIRSPDRPARRESVPRGLAAGETTAGVIGEPLFDSQLRLGAVFTARALATTLPLVQILLVAVSVEVDCAWSCSSTSHTLRCSDHFAIYSVSLNFLDKVSGCSDGGLVDSNGRMICGL
jgi:hypothetical protein